MKSPALIFDLDGTLVDSAPDLATALNHTLGREGLSPVGLDDIRHMVGLGARRLIEQGIEFSGRHYADGDIDRLLGVFLDYYRRNLCRETALFEGAERVVRDLAAQHAMGICTNKPEDLAVDLIEQLGMRPFFPVILGGDSLPYKKPDARIFAETLKRLGEFDAAIMIGDSQTDVATARGAGVPVIAVSFGYTAVAPKDLNADILIESFADLPRAIDEVMR